MHFCENRDDEDVEPENRPDWACTPGDEVHIVVPRDKREAALELTRWVSRVCLNCETVLMPKVRACQKCGTPASDGTCPAILSGLAQVLVNAESSGILRETALDFIRMSAPRPE